MPPNHACLTSISASNAPNTQSVSISDHDRPAAVHPKHDGPRRRAAPVLGRAAAGHQVQPTLFCQYCYPFFASCACVLNLQAIRCSLVCTFAKTAVLLLPCVHVHSSCSQSSGSCSFAMSHLPLLFSSVFCQHCCPLFALWSTLCHAAAPTDAILRSPLHLHALQLVCLRRPGALDRPFYNISCAPDCHRQTETYTHNASSQPPPSSCPHPREWREAGMRVRTGQLGDILPKLAALVEGLDHGRLALQRAVQGTGAHHITARQLVRLWL